MMRVRGFRCRAWQFEGGWKACISTHLRHCRVSTILMRNLLQFLIGFQLIAQLKPALGGLQMEAVWGLERAYHRWLEPQPINPAPWHADWRLAL